MVMTRVINKLISQDPEHMRVLVCFHIPEARRLSCRSSSWRMQLRGASPAGDSQIKVIRAALSLEKASEKIRSAGFVSWSALLVTWETRIINKEQALRVFLLGGVNEHLQSPLASI